MTKEDPAQRAIIEQLIANTEELLKEHYHGAFQMRDDTGKVKIGLIHEVNKNEFGELIANSKLKYGKRVTAETEHAVDTTQMHLNLEKKKNGH